MPKVTLPVILLLGLLCFLTFPSVSLVKSQLQESGVSINADGSIEPLTAPIDRIGNIYTLTGNISCGLIVHRSNIVIDGAGYALNGGDSGSVGIDLRNNVTSVPSSEEIWNVTVKNLAIINYDSSIQTSGGGNNTFYNDYVANTMAGLRGGVYFWACSGNNIIHCTVNGDPAVYIHFCSNHNSVVENNLSGGASVEVSGAENFDRNYWSDYRIKYPNVTEVDSSRIWRTPYRIAADSFSTDSIQDNHPQKNPFTFASSTGKQTSEVPELSLIALLPLTLVLVSVLLFKIKRFRYSSAF